VQVRNLTHKTMQIRIKQVMLQNVERAPEQQAAAIHDNASDKDAEIENVSGEDLDLNVVPQL
jgi:hypothetical protein